jgi:hypothetical protein
VTPEGAGVVVDVVEAGAGKVEVVSVVIAPLTGDVVDGNETLHSTYRLVLGLLPVPSPVACELKCRQKYPAKLLKHEL